MDEEAKRKLQAKRLKEHMKLIVTTVNATGLVVFGAGVLQPLVAASSHCDGRQLRRWVAM